MQEYIITFETAKLAKEKGLNIKSAKYSIDGKLVGSGNNEGFYNAPTQSLLQRWLRDMHDIHVTPRPYKTANKRLYFVSIGDSYNDITLDGYSSYEEVLEQGLQEALNLIEN